MYTLIDNGWKELYMKKMVIFLVCFASLLFFQAQAWAVSIDLNDFHATGNVTVAVDGSSATMREDPAYGSVLLSRDPYFLNCTGLYIPAAILIMEIAQIYH